MAKRLFGKTSKGEEVYAFELTNSKGMKAEVINYGAILTKLFTADKNGKIEDIVLGFDTVAEYEVNASFFGAVIAPSANRIGGAKYTIDGVEYKAAVNDGPNNLHSDYNLGSHKRVWDYEEGENSVKFSLEMEDGDMGFPGNKKFTITYTLTEDNELILHYTGSSDKKTIINPTNHTYFNLSGEASGKTILDDVLMLNASCYTPIVQGAIPTGEIAPVAGTVMDFTKGRRVGDDIEDSFDQLVMTQGYDHNFVLDNYDGKTKLIATVTDNESGRVMEVYTNLPGVQFYAGNCIAPQNGKNGVKYSKRMGLCLETQFFPDSINKANFPSCVFGAGKDYDSETIYKF